MKRSIYILIALFMGITAYGQQDYKSLKDIPYIGSDETNQYRVERCKLDIYYPVGKKDYPTLIWFHGGGLRGGEKHLPETFKEQGFAVVSVNYRLSGERAKNPDYTVDAAEAVAWVFRHIREYGGNPDKIYVSGHSAGGYLTLMLAMDKSYLAAYGIDADSVRGYYPIGGQTVTHFTIRAERNLPQADKIPVIDKYAPINNARKLGTELVLITGDRKLEMLARYEENLYLKAVLEGVGNKEVPIYEIKGFNHGSVGTPAQLLINEFIKKSK